MQYVRSQVNRECYWDRGWTVVEGVYSDAEVDRIVKVATEISERELAPGLCNALGECGDGLGEGCGQEWVLQPRRLSAAERLHGDELILDDQMEEMGA